jgi:hypothetical protein
MNKKQLRLLISIALAFILTACGTLPRLQAQERMFLDLSLEFLGEYQLSKQDFQGTPVGGLSAITYDRQKNRFYAISDDRSNFAPARFYTLNLNLDTTEGDRLKIEKVAIESVTFLKNEAGENYPAGAIDLEGIALSPRGTLFISSEGAVANNSQPFIGEFDLTTGQLQQNIKIPQRFLFAAEKATDSEPQGIQDNLGFESLTLGISSVMRDDPFRLFVATESALKQDSPPQNPEDRAKIRLLHYVINSVGEPVLVSENLYLLDAAPSDALSNGLSELLALEREGYLLSLERTFGLSGFNAKIYQVISGDATDTSRILKFQPELGKIIPLKKELLLDLSELGIELDNLEGMTLGPKLPDGSRLLVTISDDNFEEEQVTQLLLFRLTEGGR